ncbi:MAG: aspartate/glutamate racemase family protein [Oscillospiraceae bacterium]|nr:aspartate/glutamate racemase family protein [Oscillospiraceae bacterium]
MNPGDIVIETVVCEYLTPIKEQGVDTVVLGCTHYPLLTGVIANFMGDGVTLVDSGAATAEAVAAALSLNDGLTDRTVSGGKRYFVTDSTEGFEHVASMFLGDDLSGEVSRVSLEEY